MYEKGDGTCCPCGDCALNVQKLPKRYPLLFLTGFMTNLRGKTIFSKIDLQKVFHQLPIYPDDIRPFWIYAYDVRPLQRRPNLIIEVLRGLGFVYSYICVVSSSLKQTSPNLSKFFVVYALTTWQLICWSGSSRECWRYSPTAIKGCRFKKIPKPRVA